MGYTLADPIIGLIITAVILGIVWQSAKAVLTRMLDGVEPQMISELHHAAEHARGVLNVESVRARWLGHRLRAEMRLAVDPALSLTDARKVADEVKEHARGHLPALESLHVELVPASGRERPKDRPEAEHQHRH
jgi:divalent metal cation (Fe/Co/Zn/Cd) transporter